MQHNACEERGELRPVGEAHVDTRDPWTQVGEGGEMALGKLSYGLWEQIS